MRRHRGCCMCASDNTSIRNAVMTAREKRNGAGNERMLILMRLVQCFIVPNSTDAHHEIRDCNKSSVWNSLTSALPHPRHIFSNSVMTWSGENFGRSLTLVRVKVEPYWYAERRRCLCYDADNKGSAPSLSKAIKCHSPDLGRSCITLIAN
jgi:hypothetical protein